jgi:hypothetical protein
VTELKGTFRLELAGWSTRDGVSTNLCDESCVIASKEAHHGLMLWESKYDFRISKLNNLKVIHDLYSQCLTQILSKTSSNTNMEGVYCCTFFI